MKTLREFLSPDPIATIHLEAIRKEILLRLDNFLPEEIAVEAIGWFERFTYQRPWKFWDAVLVSQCLEVLENDSARSWTALTVRSGQIGIGVENQLRSSLYDDSERSPGSVMNTKEILYLSKTLHPEYLRRVEHVYSNLLVLYWATLKRKGVEGKFNLRSAVALLRSKNYDFMIPGYSERIRNAIAHGQVVFQAESILYGVDGEPLELSLSEFLVYFNEIERTNNALLLSLLVFLARQYSLGKSLEFSKLPHSLIALMATSTVAKYGLILEGALILYGHEGTKELWVSARMPFLNRQIVLVECTRWAMKLLDMGGTGFESYVFYLVHEGKSVPSYVTVDAGQLERLLDQALSDSTIEQIVSPTRTILLYNESPRRHRLRGLRLLLRSLAKKHWDELTETWRNLGIRVGQGQYEIRKIKNKSSSGICRIEALVVLKNPSIRNRSEYTRDIVLILFRELEKMYFDPTVGDLERRRTLFKKNPGYIAVRLFAEDGTISWLEESTRHGNIVLFAEKISDKRVRASQIAHPDETWKGIRIKYPNDFTRRT